ncbi:putative DNA (cytosine-5)-methyltransferase CMT1 [Trifolium repens]|nr:putative DNA (cytosine-5)-methyltransferase CMT1 [Trifolium repens]
MSLLNNNWPFGRLWWDEIVSAVVKRLEPHNQALLHPHQDRVLTIRENASYRYFQIAINFGALSKRGTYKLEMQLLFLLLLLSDTH